MHGTRALGLLLVQSAAAFLAARSPRGLSMDHRRSLGHGPARRQRQWTVGEGKGARSSRVPGVQGLACSSAGPAEWEVSERVRTFLQDVDGNPLRGLEAADKAWSFLRSDAFTKPPATPAVVTAAGQTAPVPGAQDVQCDVVVAGGTLGIFVAAALAAKGIKVAVLEQGKLVGRTQEWNISRKELVALVELGILTQEELDRAIITDYSPQRVGFSPDGEAYELDTINGVLNLGVDPLSLIAMVKDSFLRNGGLLLEEHAFKQARIFDDGVTVTGEKRAGGAASARGAGGAAAFDDANAADGVVNVTGKLLLDAMGNFSPIMRQARGYAKPQGVCLVVGTCARGPWVDNSKGGDLIFSFTPIAGDRQYFWEAFPSQDLHGSREESRTTYMFTYVDADSRRPSLATMFDDYLELLPDYSGAHGPQGQKPVIGEMKVSRALFGLFPSYTDSPLPVRFDRVVQVGDSSGLQSPLSFGGFGSLLRHLHRTTSAIQDALECDIVAKEDLTGMQPYLPSLSTMWLFQKAMSVRVGKEVFDADIINKVLTSNFKTMDKLGSGVMMPFLQDVIQATGLAATIGGMSVFDPLLVPPLLRWVGPLVSSERETAPREKAAKGRDTL